MIDQPWSRTEKELARELFDEARERERQAILREIHSILNAGKSLDVVWDVHDYLTKKRREMDEKYDFRYSQMILIFARLIREGWLEEDELSGLRPEKLEAIRHLLSL